MEMNEDVDVGKEFTSSFHPAAGAQNVYVVLFVCFLISGSEI